MSSRWTIDEKNKLKRLYLKTEMPLEEICRSLQRTPQAIQSRLSLRNIKKRRFVSRVRHPDKITVELARIHAHICGDGHLCRFKEKDSYGPWARYRKQPYRIRYKACYTNTHPDLLAEFQRDIRKVFGVKGYKWGDEIRVHSKRVWGLAIEMGAGNSYNWSIPQEIIKGPRSIRRGWIRAFFDDEAYFNDQGRIRVKSVNKKGLFQIVKMLKDFVPCHITPRDGLHKEGTAYLSINKNDSHLFFKKIGSVRCKTTPG